MKEEWLTDPIVINEWDRAVDCGKLREERITHESGSNK